MTNTSSSLLPIAIVGIASQIPSGLYAPVNLDHKEFFDFLLNKGEVYERIPMERFKVDSYKGINLGQVCTEVGTFLKHTDQIDHVELGITAKDAKSMSLSTRKLIELSFHALLDSGIDYRSQNVGCFASGIIFDVLSLSEPDEFEARGSFGGPPAMIANRISYHLDLLGPSVPVDTACSSSLTATHLAVQSIRAGDCDSAVVAGIQLNHRFIDWIQYSQGGILAPDGKCKPFDAAANGFSRGEAGVAIVLKRMDKAINDGDRIYGTILGTGINSSGSAAPVNAPPVADAQQDAMLRAWKQTGRNPKDVDFVEVHATGTAAGDPVEANWVGNAFKRETELLIGSVKGNIGHTEIAAFLVSLTKCIHIFRSGVIPPNVNLSSPNPRIKWDEYNLRIPRESTPLLCRSVTGRSLIGLCSSGIGGANGHVVLEAPPSRSKDTFENQHNPKAYLLMSGALSPRSTEAISERLLDLISERPELLSVISTVYGRRARQMPWRSFAVITPNQATKVKFTTPVLAPRSKPSIVFVFAGQGPQHILMGRELFSTYPVFRKSILEMDAVYHKVVGKSLIYSTGLFVGDDPDAKRNRLGDIWPIQITLPALAMLQCALVDLLRSTGINPSIAVGHSAGETAVLYASGATSKEIAIKIAIVRGKAMVLLESEGGTMAAVSCSVSQARSLIQESLSLELQGTIDIGCHNSREAVTISGLASSIDVVVSKAESRGFMARRLRTRVPVHSHMMDVCREEFYSLFKNISNDRPSSWTPSIPVYSTVTGGLLKTDFNADYLWQGIRQPVRFTEAITSLISKYPNAIVIELSPHPVLLSYLSDLGCGAPTSVLRRPKRQETGPVEIFSFLEGLGRVVSLGQNSIDFSTLNGNPPIDIDFAFPSYPFSPKNIPYHANSTSFFRQFEDRNGPLNHKALRINAQTHPVLSQHVIKGEPIMPAAGYIEMALEFGASVLWDIEFRVMMSLSGEQPTPVEVKLDGAHWSVKTTSSGSVKSNFDKTHAEGFLSLEPVKLNEPLLDIQTIAERCDPIDLTNFYEELKSFADYGPAFQRVTNAKRGKNEVLVRVQAKAADIEIESYRFHPAILDCCLHFMVHKSFTLNEDPNIYYLPSKVGKLVIHPDFVELGMPDFLYVHIVYKKWTPNTIVADFFIVTIDGIHLCTLTNVVVERHEGTPNLPVARRYDLHFQPLSSPETVKDDIVIVTSNHNDLRELYKYLDLLAVDAFKKALDNNASPGNEINRIRYARAAKKATSSFASYNPPSQNDIARFQRVYPEMMEITQRISSIHKKIFATSKATVEILYKDDIMTKFYKHYDWASELLAKRFYSLVERLVSTGKSVIRVLEVGSGTGALTRHLIKIMECFPNIVIEFVISDVSKELIPRMDYPHCRYQSFDLELPPSEQGLETASLDVILGFHVLHVVSEIQPALEALGTLLVPGGSLIIGDLRGDSWTIGEPGSVWFDFVFGSFAEWFSFTDGREHCTMSPEVWSQQLYKSNFAHVYSECYSCDPLLFSLEAQTPLFILPHSIKNNQQDDVPQVVHHDIKGVLCYRRGGEGCIRKLLADDENNSLSLWLFTKSSDDRYSGMGFSRSLAREYPDWDIHFVIFDGDWRENQMLSVISLLKGNPEPLILVDNSGNLFVPRVIPTSAPGSSVLFETSSPWCLTDEGFKSEFVARPSKEYAIVDILAISQAEGALRGFVGRVVTPSESGISDNQIVGGITSSKHTVNRIAVHEDSMVSISENDEPSAANMASSFLALVICHLSLGRDMRGKRRRVLLAHASDAIAPSLRWALRLANTEVVEPNVGLTLDADLAHLVRQGDIVISGSQDALEIQILSSSITSGKSIFFWNDSMSGVEATLKGNPAVIGDALQTAFNRVGSNWRAKHDGILLRELDFPTSSTYVPASPMIFNPFKAYLLVGGIGGIGIRVALWMYQKGARYIVLTSRSGKNSLTRTQDKLAIRIVDYLESLPDLTIRLETSDATSTKATNKLIQSIPFELGGCMLLTAVLVDRSFALQTDEDFDAVFASKPGACHVLDECIQGGLAALDFFIPFSSVVGLLGNAGQTNYSSANTALDGISRSLSNSFSFILPAVIDGGGLVSETGARGGRLGHLTPWGMTSQQICDCLEDGLRKLTSGPFWQYIPNLDWSLVEKHMGSSRLFGHLVENAAEATASETSTSGRSMNDIIIKLLDVEPSDFDADVPFTSYGLDSLSAAQLSLALRPYYSISQLQLLSDVSLNDLQRRIDQAAEEKDERKEATPPLIATGTYTSRLEEMTEMIKKYTQDFKHSPGLRESSVVGEVVLVTGTTGAIGTSLLSHLAAMKNVSRIYAFNRQGAESLHSRQVSSLRERGYDPIVLEDERIILVEGDQTRYDLGIPPSLYEEIQHSVTLIIHNAWPVNFTSTLTSLEPTVRSVRAFVDLALGSPFLSPPRILFLSSIGLYRNRKGSGPAPENYIPDGSLVFGTGYTESKWVAEGILQKVAEETPLRPIIVRIGQICGGVNGSWSTSEWFPTLIKSSLQLGALPANEGDISWIPLHTAAKVLIDMRHAEQSVLHLSHPRPIQWEDISRFLSSILSVPLISYTEWLTRLEETAQTSSTENTATNYGLRLLSYFRGLEIGMNDAKEAFGLPRLNVTEGIRASTTLRDADPLTMVDVASWINHWQSIGFLKK